MTALTREAGEPHNSPIAPSMHLWCQLGDVLPALPYTHVQSVSGAGLSMNTA